VLQALRSGGLGFVHKLRSKRDLGPAIEAALCGSRFVSSNLDVDLLHLPNFEHPQPVGLSAEAPSHTESLIQRFWVMSARAWLAGAGCSLAALAFLAWAVLRPKAPKTMDAPQTAFLPKSSRLRRCRKNQAVTRYLVQMFRKQFIVTEPYTTTPIRCVHPNPARLVPNQHQSGFLSLLRPQGA
jgi:hypothetical protein